MNDIRSRIIRWLSSALPLVVVALGFVLIVALVDGMRRRPRDEDGP